MNVRKKANRACRRIQSRWYVCKPSTILFPDKFGMGRSLNINGTFGRLHVGIMLRAVCGVEHAGVCGRLDCRRRMRAQLSTEQHVLLGELQAAKVYAAASSRCRISGRYIRTVVCSGHTIRQLACAVVRFTCHKRMPRSISFCSSWEIKISHMTTASFTRRVVWKPRWL